VNVTEETVEKMMDAYHKDPTRVSVFHSAIMEIFPVVHNFWRKYIVNLTVSDVLQFVVTRELCEILKICCSVNAWKFVAEKVAPTVREVKRGSKTVL